MNLAPLWISPAVLGWKRDVECWTDADLREWKFAYCIWAHAAELIEIPPPGRFRAHARHTLRRALRHRLDLLKRKCAIPRSFAVAFPGAFPSSPRHAGCHAFLDFVWRFLRATEPLARCASEARVLRDPQDPHYWLSASFQPRRDWPARLCGWLPPPLLSALPRPGWLPLANATTETRRQALLRPDPFWHDLVGNAYDERGRDPDDVHLDGLLDHPVFGPRLFLACHFDECAPPSPLALAPA